MAQNLDQYLAESGKQSELDQIRNVPGGYEKAVSYYNTTGQYGGVQSAYGSNPTSADQVNPFLNNFQSSLYNSDAPQVRVPTMEELKTELAPKTAAPEAISRIQIQETQREKYGVPDMEKQLSDVKSLMQETEAVKRQRTHIEEGKPVAMGVIAGRVGEVERQENERLDVLLRQSNTLTDQLNTAYNTINQYINLAGLDYQDAVNKYDSEFNRNVTMYNMVAEAQGKAVDQYYKERDYAKANLQTYMSAITAGNLNYSQLSDDQKLQITKLEMQSQLPIGFISSLSLSPKDSILNINDETGEALIIDGSGNFKMVQTGMTPTGTGSGTSGMTATQLKAANAAALKALDKVDASYRTINGKLVSQDESSSTTPFKADKLLSEQEAEKAVEEIMKQTGLTRTEAYEIMYQAFDDGKYDWWGKGK